MSDYSVEEIIRAKRVARENGYTVEMPKDEIEQAMNIAKSAGYTVKDASAMPAPAAKPAASEPAAKPAAPAAAEPPKRPTVWDIAAKYL